MGRVRPPVVIVCTVVDVETKLMVPSPVSVKVMVATRSRATLPTPTVALPIVSTEVVAAKVRVLV